MRWWLLFLPLFLQADECQLAEARLTLNDFQGALEELQGHSDSKAFLEMKIKVLAARGDHQSMIASWKQYQLKFPENRDLVEIMAWGVIRKGSQESSPQIRLISTLAAALSQDAKGVAIVQRALHDSNSAVRRAAVSFSANLQDDKLKSEMVRLFREERVYDVRLEVIKALRQRSYLEAIVASDESRPEERVAAIYALVELLDTVSREEIVALASSNRMGLRLLACKLIGRLGFSSELLTPLLQDNFAIVRTEALLALGKIRPKELPQLPLDDSDSKTAITAAWLATLYGSPEPLKRFLTHESERTRLFAAAALAATGKYGLPLMLETFRTSKEPLVKLNLAIGLIGQRAAIVEAREPLNTAQNLAWNEKYPFRFLESSNETNQEVRLELLNLMAILKHPHAEQALKNFLQERHWNLTNMAAGLLLTEGGPEVLDLVRGLLTDPNKTISLQAAITLALWGRDPEALETLKHAYPTATREDKEMILEAFANIHDKKTLPFLLEAMDEPAPILRVIAAFALLQCLR